MKITHRLCDNTEKHMPHYWINDQYSGQQWCSGYNRVEQDDILIIYYYSTDGECVVIYRDPIKNRYYQYFSRGDEWFVGNDPEYILDRINHKIDTWPEYYSKEIPDAK